MVQHDRIELAVPQHDQPVIAAQHMRDLETVALQQSLG